MEFILVIYRCYQEAFLMWWNQYCKEDIAVTLTSTYISFMTWRKMPNFWFTDSLCTKGEQQQLPHRTFKDQNRLRRINMFAGKFMALCPWQSLHNVYFGRNIHMYLQIYNIGLSTLKSLSFLTFNHYSPLSIIFSAISS